MNSNTSTHFDRLNVKAQCQGSVAAPRLQRGVWNFKLKPKEQWKVRSAKKEELKRKRVEETATPATLTRSALDKMGAESLLSLSSSWLDTEEEGSEKGQDGGSGEGSQIGKPGNGSGQI